MSWLWIALLGCSPDYGVDKSPDAPEDPEPAVEVWPSSLYFDGVPVGQSAAATVRVGNVGDVNVDITRAFVEGAVFAVDDVDGATLIPGEELELEVVFTPTDPEHAAVLWIDTTDPRHLQVGVDLAGRALFPRLIVDPSPYDFGEHGVGCPSEATFTVSSAGDGPLQVDAVDVLGPGYRLATWPDLPWTLEPGEEREVVVDFTPELVEAAVGYLQVSSNDPAGRVDVSLSGAGLVEDVEDRFVQGLYTRLDLILTVDQSCSMDRDIEHVGDNAPALLDALAEFGDFQVGVVTNDSGCTNAIVTESSAAAHDTFADALRGFEGNDTERGFKLALAALEEARPGGCNEALRREDAHLEILHISDEPEQSPFPYTDYLLDLGFYDPSARVSAVAGPVPEGCQRADPGWGYSEAAIATEGVFVDFCFDDWGGPLQTLATGVLTAPPRGEFRLTRTPADPAAIEVEVDGEVAVGWTYVPGPNAVVFEEGAWPTDEAVILVRYSGIPDCDA
jgi:hypothetical protein